LNATAAALKHCAVASGPPLEAVPLGQRLHSQRGSELLLFLLFLLRVEAVDEVAHVAGSSAEFFFFVDAPSAPAASVLP
jgi:hypothetical protein